MSKISISSNVLYLFRTSIGAKSSRLMPKVSCLVKNSSIMSKISIGSKSVENSSDGNKALPIALKAHLMVRKLC